MISMILCKNKQKQNKPKYNIQLVMRCIFYDIYCDLGGGRDLWSLLKQESQQQASSFGEI